MDIEFSYGKEGVVLKVPDESMVYTSCYEPVDSNPAKMMIHSILNPIGCQPFNRLLEKRKKGKIVIVVSDITRPIPYHSFLPDLLEYILNQGIGKDEVILLVATGMHRASTLQEKIYMFGKNIVDNYRIIDHNAENTDELITLSGKSWSGNEIKLNLHYVEAGFRILTGLVETHFMAGFSGGRKSICPGLASLDTIQRFHGYHFLNHPNASNALLENNPCHLENTSVAQACPADFSINIILNKKKNINRIFSGEPFESHKKAVDYVREKSCKTVEVLADAVITSCGGYPLDDTFYQCVKGFVNCLPALKENGEIIALGGCSEGIGSPEYKQLMKKYSFRPDDFLNDIKNERFFIKDQWQFQMHIRVLKKIGQDNLHFYTTGIPPNELNLMSVNAHFLPENTTLTKSVQMQIDRLIASGKKIAVFPEGPYCSPI
jgi:nickel-dependent lactate racemase